MRRGADVSTRISRGAADPRTPAAGRAQACRRRRRPPARRRGRSRSRISVGARRRARRRRPRQRSARDRRLDSTVRLGVGSAHVRGLSRHARIACRPRVEAGAARAGHARGCLHARRARLVARRNRTRARSRRDDEAGARSWHGRRAAVLSRRRHCRLRRRSGAIAPLAAEGFGDATDVAAIGAIASRTCARTAHRLVVRTHPHVNATTRSEECHENTVSVSSRYACAYARTYPCVRARRPAVRASDGACVQPYGRAAHHAG